MNKSRVAARFMLPAVAAAAVIGGAVAPASAEPVTHNANQNVTRDLPVVGGLLKNVLGGGNLLGGLLGGAGGGGTSPVSLG